MFKKIKKLTDFDLALRLQSIEVPHGKKLFTKETIIMDQSLATTTRNARSTVSHAFSKDGALSVGGIAIAELAILGAAGYVLWKNKEQIQILLEKGGVEVPSIMKADMNELVATGASFLAKSKRAFAEHEGKESSPMSSSNTSSSNNFSNSGSAPSASSNKPASSSNAQFANKDSSLGTRKSSSTIHDA